MYKCSHVINWPKEDKILTEKIRIININPNKVLRLIKKFLKDSPIKSIFIVYMSIILLNKAVNVYFYTLSPTNFYVINYPCKCLGK